MHDHWSDDDADTSFDKLGEPNKCIMKLYEELLESRANPFGLDRFSCKEKVHIGGLIRILLLRLPGLVTLATSTPVDAIEKRTKHW